MLKKLIISLFILAALAIAGLSAYISTIDWNKHKSKIAAQIENVTGKRVVFEGAVSMSFFPTPYLTAKNIKIYNKDGENTAEPLAIIREMVTDLSLMPLLHGEFVIDNMSMLNANILIEFLPNGKLNWYSQITEYQKDTLDNVDIALNSVMLKDASVQIVNEGLGIDVSLQNLNAEITAQSLFGPYRIDGNFIKDNNPAGFALNLGTLSESFATSLNLVLTHPTTESYARFDGSMLSSANEIKGNFIVESKNPSTFINELTNQVILPEEFNYPLAFSVEVNTNPQQIDLSSFVIKYGENTAGTGNILIPLKLKKGEEKRQIELSFEMTELDLMPIVGIIKEQLKKYDNNKTAFEPYFDYDAIADIKAVKATYRNQAIRNFNLSADLINDILTIKNLSGLFPGDTDLTLSGDIFESEKVLSYDLKLKSLSQDSLKFLEWLNIKPGTYAQSTYRSGQLNLGISGNLNQIKISPMQISMDKISANGVAGIIRGKRNQMFLAVETDSVNFDNYLPQLSAEEQKLPLAEKIKFVLNKFSFLNDVDLHLEAKLNLGIYNKTPFEDLNLLLDTEQGTVKLQQLSIANIASSAVNFSGNISGLGINPNFENLKYSFSSEDMQTFINKFNLPLPNLPLIKNAKKAEAKGIFTGNLNDANIKAVTSFERLNSVYSGKLYNQNNQLAFRGLLEFKTPDFTNFVNALGFNYKPENLVANIFTFKGNINGNSSDWQVKDLNAFVGSNNFKGSFSADLNSQRPIISADLQANKFEFDRFIYNIDRELSANAPRKHETFAFLEKPSYSSTNINYSFFKTFDLSGKFRTGTFSLGTNYLENVSADVEINEGVIKVANILAEKDKGKIKGQFNLDINASPLIKGIVDLEGFNVHNLGGTRYAVTSGTLKAHGEYESSAASEIEFIANLKGKLSFDIENAAFKGWDLEVIEVDLSQRTHSDNLYEVLRDNLQKGSSTFELIGAELNFEKGAYTFKDALMASNFATLDVSGSGSLINWDTNTSFKLVFEHLRDKIVPIDFQWTGSLANPNMIVDGSALKHKYDNYWDTLARQQKATEQARINALNEKMATTQQTVKRLKELTAGEILPKLAKYTPLSSNAEIKSKYDTNNLLTIDINNQLDAMVEKADNEFTDADIIEMNATLESFEPQLNTIAKEIDANYILDTKTRAGNAYNDIINVYQNSQGKAGNYQKTLDAYAIRLMQLSSLVVLDRDPRASDYKNKVETSFRTIEDLKAKSGNVKEIIQNTDNITELELQLKIMEELHSKSINELNALNDSLEQLFDYAKRIVREEEYGGPLPEENNKQDSKITISEKPQEGKSVSVDEKLPEQNLQPSKPLPAPTENENSEPVVSLPVVQKQPLLLPTNSKNNVITYQSKLVPSGTIKKSGRVLQTEKPAAQPVNDNAPLLRPITEKNIVSGGVIKK